MAEFFGTLSICPDNPGRVAPPGQAPWERCAHSVEQNEEALCCDGAGLLLQFRCRGFRDDAETIACEHVFTVPAEDDGSEYVAQSPIHCPVCDYDDPEQEALLCADCQQPIEHYRRAA